MESTDLIMPIDPYHGAEAYRCHCSGCQHYISLCPHPAVPAVALLSPPAHKSFSSEKILKKVGEEF